MDYLAILRQHDDQVHWEYPPNLDYAGAVTKFKRFATSLAEALRAPLRTETESYIQDASFHSQIFVPLPDGGFTLIRFSNFGDMVTIGEDQPVPENVREIVLNLFEKFGYVYIPADVLEQAYTARDPKISCIRTWWIRFFDWL
jgi:hypothetical protein